MERFSVQGRISQEVSLGAYFICIDISHWAVAHNMMYSDRCGSQKKISYLWNIRMYR
jgi:hypothetical protein